MDTQSNRPHRASKEKKVPKKGEKNVKAFAVAHPGRLAKQAVRSSDIKEKRLHVPQVDRIPEEAPPIVTAVVGPPGVGKTTLIKSLIKRYSKQTLSHPIGPLTVVTSKRRRLTIIECPSDSLAAMIDTAKIADIVLLMIDGNYGFEMETMEFLNALSTSGMPGNVFGVLTHLDLFKSQSTLKATKKRLKHRFWSELYQGAKLFYLSGVINGRYPDREIHNLSRFLSVMKNPRPLVWRNSHPYCLADRFLDVTPPIDIEADPKCDRRIALYGYLRGTNFPSTNARVHVPGVGDLNASEIESLPDPCPTPHLEQAMQKSTGKKSRRRLDENQKILFAPMSDVGGVLVDKDAVYIDIKTTTFDRDAAEPEDRGVGEQLMLSLQNERKLLGQSEEGVRLFMGGNQLLQDREMPDGGRHDKRVARTLEPESIKEVDDDVSKWDEEVELESDNGETDEEESAYGRHIHNPSPGSEDFRDHVQRGSDSGSNAESDTGSISGDSIDYEPNGWASEDEDQDDDGAVRWKSNLMKHIRTTQGSRLQYRAGDLSRLLYDLTLTPDQVVRNWTGGIEHAENQSQTVEDEFFRRSKIETEEDSNDRQFLKYDYTQLAVKWQNHDAISAVRRRFIRQSTAGEDDHNHQTEVYSGLSGSEVDTDEGDGSFEDLEAPDNSVKLGLSIEQERQENAKRKEELRARFEVEDRDGVANPNNAHDHGDPDFGEDDWYDAQKAMLQKQQNINRAEFDSLGPQARARVEGFKAGTYARIVLDKVPYEFAHSFNPRYPIIVGGLASTEDRFGFVQIRIKRHRWHKKILKTNDPLIFSLGWRRFQTLPIYSISDSRTRNRMLKYTPEHMHCFGTFYGPLVAPNTGFCCVQSFSNGNPGFRIAATGVVLNVDESSEIVKKLKLTGHPYKIFRNTAFIRDMFSSSIEIAKFEGASIKTVSGIRGQIKRALSKPEGHFRATFEDKILMSDIVFLRAWYPIQPHRFYNPVTNLLDAPVINNGNASHDGTSAWQAMRLTGQVRAALELPTPRQKDSAYSKIERPTRHFNPLRVPRALATKLPFKSQITQQRARKTGQTYLQKRAVVVGGEEKKARDLMQKLMTLRNEKVEKRAKKQEERRSIYRKRVEENLEKKNEREKRERDEFWQKEGKKRSAQANGGGRKRRRT